jgi:hypothetical protein
MRTFFITHPNNSYDTTKIKGTLEILLDIVNVMKCRMMIYSMGGGE